MLKNIVRAHEEKTVSYMLLYDDGDSGYGFPCDEHGKVADDLSDEAKQNLAWCREHKETFARAGIVEKYVNFYTEPAYGTCSCGEKVYLCDMYMGACQCEKCGKWYNLSGQELLPPEEWGWDGTPFDPD